MFTSGSGPGIMYGSPKVHKPDTPLRPILAAYNTPTFKLAKFLVPLLEPFTSNNYTIKNSCQFQQYITSCHPRSDSILASFDVASLFTNNPILETINIICDKAFQHSEQFHGMDRNTLFNLLKITCQETSFLFDGVPCQVEGVSMGSPIGPTLANIFLCHHEDKWLHDCPTEFKPIFYKRYVDDTCTLFYTPEHPENFLNYLNEKHANIKFTLEIEDNESLPFIDIQIVNANIVKTAVYRTSTCSGMGLNFFSVCSPKFKINAINTLLYRAYHLSSDYLLFHKEIEFLKMYLQILDILNTYLILPAVSFSMKYFHISRHYQLYRKMNSISIYHIIQFAAKLVSIH